MMWQVCQQPCGKHNNDRMFLRVAVAMPPAAGRNLNIESLNDVFLRLQNGR
jgi:hypothetical protein